MTRGQEGVDNLATEETIKVPDKTIAEIRLLSEIAKANSSLLSLQDIVELTRINQTENQLEANWPSLPGLARLYEVSNGFLEEQGKEGSALQHRELEKRARAWKYATFARKFAPLFKSNDTQLIAISGSTSYKAVSDTDDLDFFCVTRPESVWIFLARTLVLSRIFRLVRRNSPRICFSYTVDQGFADRDFTSSRDALFARDALSAIVVFGQQSYNRLLKKSPWVARYFPRLYLQRTHTAIGEGGDLENWDSSHTSLARRFLNLFLYYTVGNYVSMKSSLLNRRYRHLGKSSSQFAVRFGPDHCIFESVRYSQLRNIYRKFDATSETGETDLASTGSI